MDSCPDVAGDAGQRLAAQHAIADGDERLARRAHVLLTRPFAGASPAFGDDGPICTKEFKDNLIIGAQSP